MVKNNIIIFDGVCNMCSSVVNFIMKHDRQQQFFFTANQSETGQALLEKFELPTQEVGTIYYYENGVVYQQSEAALRIARQLQFPWNIVSIFRVVPRVIRDGIYKWVARNRYNWFGKKESCRIPTEAERARFL